MPGNSGLGYRLIDADNHYYEPYDCFTRHLELAFADRSVHVVKDEQGLGRLYFGVRKLGFMRVIQSDYTGAPGSLQALFGGKMEQGFVQSEVINAHDYPAMMHKGPRLAADGRAGAGSDADVPDAWPWRSNTSCTTTLRPATPTCAPSTSGSRKTGATGPTGVFSPPRCSRCSTPDHAVAELDRVMGAGALAWSTSRPGLPMAARPPTRPMTPSGPGSTRPGCPWRSTPATPATTSCGLSSWGEQARPPLQYMTPFQWDLGYGGRPIADMLANLILNNLFGRFPRLRVLSIENGSDWVPGLLQGMDKAAKVGRRSTPVGGHVQDLPSEVFRRYCWVSPYFEEDPVPLSELIGVDRILFGSDWPHSEGIAEPAEFAGKLTALGEDGTRKIMRSNVAELIGLPG